MSVLQYELKGGEEIRDGKLYGWTGSDCQKCKGTGEIHNEECEMTSCANCDGTGEEWGLMPIQPDNLPK